jgi:hypothetical protein
MFQLMRSLPRLALNGSAVVSALLFMALPFLWARSYRMWGMLEKRTLAGGEYSIRASDGRVEIRVARGLEQGNEWFVHGWGPRLPPTDWSQIPSDAIGVITFEMMWDDDFMWVPDAHFGRWGFRGYSARYMGNRLPSARCWSLTVPDWSLVVAAGMLPLARLAILLAVFVRKAQPASHCRKCGYDLRATPHRCPECGEVPRQLQVEAA